MFAIIVTNVHQKLIIAMIMPTPPKKYAYVQTPTASWFRAQYVFDAFVIRSVLFSSTIRQNFSATPLACVTATTTIREKDRANANTEKRNLTNSFIGLRRFILFNKNQPKYVSSCFLPFCGIWSRQNLTATIVLRSELTIRM